MKLENTRESYYYNSGKLSDIVRQLGFVGIALVWILGLGEDAAATLPDDLAAPTILILVALVLDVLQYVVTTITWGVFNRIKERQNVGEDAEFEAPRQLNWAPLVIFWMKVVAISAAYVLLGLYTADRYL